MRFAMVALFSALLVPASPAVDPTMFDGRPTFTEGDALAYYVWRDGETWHLRWTTLGNMRNFTGSVEATGGELKSLKRIDVESETKVLYPGRPSRVFVGRRGRVFGRPGAAPVVATKTQDHIDMDGDTRIVFNTKTNDDIDGFDFKVEKSVTTLRLSLHVDGKATPNIVQAGKNNQKPRELPLVIELK